MNTESTCPKSYTRRPKRSKIASIMGSAGRAVSLEVLVGDTPEKVKTFVRGVVAPAFTVGREETGRWTPPGSSPCTRK